MPAIRGDSNDPNVPGVIGTNTNGTGVEGSSVSSRGVAGFSTMVGVLRVQVKRTRA